MKKLFNICTFIILALSVKAQSDTSSIESIPPSVSTTSQYYKHEIGVETSSLFSQVFRLFGLVKDTQSFPIAPYILSYKHYIKKQVAIRAGVGISFSKSKDRFGDFADSRIVTVKEYAGRLGLEKQRKLSKNWLITYGLEGNYVYFLNAREFDSGFDKALRSLKSNSWGISAVIGCRYDFTPQFSFGIESLLGLQFDKSTIRDEFTANPQFNKQISESNSTESKFYLPGSLFLSYRF